MHVTLCINLHRSMTLAQGRDEQHSNKLINVNFVYDMASYV